MSVKAVSVGLDQYSKRATAFLSTHSRGPMIVPIILPLLAFDWAALLFFFLFFAIDPNS
jgi:hypothetical protein